MKKICLAIGVLLIHYTMQAQQVITLYEGVVPNSKPAATYAEKNEETNGQLRTSQVINPTLTVYTPAADKNTGAAIIICPGGGYSRLAMTHEGHDVAKLFASWGITAFVLKYRLPSDSVMLDKSEGPVQDAQRAIQLVRTKASTWGVDTGKIGIIGFSAGGHLASTASTHFNKAFISNPDNISLRPNFSMLIYPVITFSEKFTHKGSREGLIGKTPKPEMVTYFSNELQVTDATPPTFLVHAGDDKAVPVENSLSYYRALNDHHIPAELHVYPGGGHGFGMNNKTTADQWTDRLQNWLKGLKVIK
ncbi:Acetyl esterase/lipase [Filimonas lacunae]|uniref:Acetyl esterase/lipase n=1 Tax=Filimonas lacunae TaxID=477680 RepID=A0A173MAX5_9BACT|nr:alpha/beta hydrolase [Filimonas lacunae]BAV04659.1 endo-1,4-beta-xylanase B [Filimonas lacunae]SIT32465.1 Acetyl esterase/lipase [Filimonas lacunae]